MKFLLDTPNIKEVVEEMQLTDYGQLITPLTSRSNRGLTFAIDNGCFKRFDYPEWTRILKRELPNKDKCEFVCLPDVVGCPFRTKALFKYYKDAVPREYKLAYVLQDGQDSNEVPWSEIAYVFVGGTDDFKLGNGAKDLIAIARDKVKIHVGRVNSIERFEYFESLGCHSCDGTGVARYTRQRKKFSELQFEDLEHAK